MSTVLGGVTVLLGAACASFQTGVPSPPGVPPPRHSTAVPSPPPPAVGLPEGTCSRSLPGVRVTYGDTPEGVLLSYTTGVNEVGRLRRILDEYADRQNQVSSAETSRPSAMLLGGGQGGAMPGAPPGTTVLVPDATVRVEHIDVGAQLYLAPVAVPLRRALRLTCSRGRVNAVATTGPLRPPTSPGGLPTESENRRRVGSGPRPIRHGRARSP